MTIFITFLAILVLDQITKYLVVGNFIVGESIPIIKDIFHFTYVRNKGAAFGMLQGQLWFFILVTIIVLVALVIFYRELPLENIITRIALGLALGGIIGNLIDRVRLGYVIDFIDWRVWPVFNIADSAIVIAVAIFSYWMLVIDNN